MRKLMPNEGDERIVRKFLWFPRTMGVVVGWRQMRSLSGTVREDKVWRSMRRWLEMASWKERYVIGNRRGSWSTYNQWTDIPEPEKPHRTLAEDAGCV